MSTRITESYLRLMIRKEIKKTINEGDVVDYETFKKFQADKEEEIAGQEKAGERVEEIKEEILRAFTDAVNQVKTRIYDEEDPQLFDDAASEIGPTLLYERFRDWVLESENDYI